MMMMMVPHCFGNATLELSNFLSFKRDYMVQR